MPASFDPYHRWLGIPAEEQPANHYRLLGLTLFESDPEVIRDAAERQIAHVRGYSLGKHSDLSQKVLNELGKAKACLLNEKEKADYDCKLSETIKSQQAKTASLSPKTPAPAAADPIQVVSRVAGKTPRTPRHPNWQMVAIGGAVALFAGLLLAALFLFGDVGGNNNTTVGENAPETPPPAPSDTARSRPGPKSASPSPTASPRAVEDVASTTTPTSNADDTPSTGDATTSADVDATGTPLATASSGETKIETSPITPVPVAIPSAEDAVSAKRLIWKEYGDDIETATTVGQRIAVTRRMFQAARVASEAAPKRFVLLTEAQRLAVAAEDAVFVNEIMDRLARDFTVEDVTESTSAWEKKAAILKELSRRAEASQDSATVAEAALATADLAARDGKPDLANSIIALAIGEARKAGDAKLFRKATLRLLDLQEGKISEITRTAPKTSTPSAVTTSPSAPPLAIAPFDETTAKQHQEAWAEYLNVPVEMTNSIGMEFVLIPPGEFDMGSTEADIARFEEEARASNLPDHYIEALPYETPKHHVRITEPFYLGICEVSQAEYERVMGSNPSDFRDDPTLPVETISWEDASAFCRRLSQLCRDQVPTAEYRLPTEAEWEYSCRAGTTTVWHSGDDEAALRDSAWYFGNSSKMTHPVRQKRPNAWGLYDMHGNVWELCQDWRCATYYKTSPTADPDGASEGLGRVIRGGCWHDVASLCRASYRRGNGPDDRRNSQGFRVAWPIPLSQQRSVEADYRLPTLPESPPASGSIPAASESSAKLKKTDAAGGRDRNSFQDVAPPGHLLVGLNVSEGDFQGYHVIWSVQAVYASLDGKVIESKTYGTPGDKMTKLIARPGYAVGGLLIKSGLLIDRFQVIFMRIGGDGLVPDDTYDSEWVGGPGGKDQQKLGGDGRPIIGIYGDYRKIVPRLGLIQGP